MLTSSARETLRGVETVIIDEIHALAATKRGAHLALTLERLEEITDAPAAAHRPVGHPAPARGDRPLPRRVRGAGRAAAGHHRRRRHPQAARDRGRRPGRGHGRARRARARATPATLGPAGRGTAPPQLDLAGDLPALLELILAHRSTIIFCNARRLAERLAARLNELPRSEARPTDAPRSSSRPTTARSPASSGSRRGRAQARRRCGRSSPRRSLELGIDMGAVDLVDPGRVAGRGRARPAAHRPRRPPGRRAEPRQDLPEAPRRPARGGGRRAERMLDGLDRGDPLPAQPARRARPADRRACARSTSGRVDELGRARAPRARTSPSSPTSCSRNVLDLLAGRYPTEEFAELRPRLVWDRVDGHACAARDGAQRLAVTSGGTIPDRGLFGVFLPDGTPGRRARRGDGLREPAGRDVPARRVDLAHRGHHVRAGHRHARRRASRARCRSGTATGPGRPLELGRALGAFVRELRDVGSRRRASSGCASDVRPRRAAPPSNLSAYLDEQAEATGAVPDDRTIVVERFRDEIGDWRVCILSPFGAPVHAPWAMAIEAPAGRALRPRRRDACGATTASSSACPRPIDELPLDELLIDPDEIDELVVARAARHRAVRVAVPRVRRAGAAAAPPPARPAHAAVAAAPAGGRPARGGRASTRRSRSCSRPPASACRTCSTCRRCARCSADLRSRAVRVVAVDTPQASPFAQSLLFGWIAVYMYEGDAPLAERRAAALALDRDLLRDLLGAEELRELLDPGVLADARARAAAPRRRPPGARRRRAARPAAPARRPDRRRDRDLRCERRRRRLARRARRDGARDPRSGSPARSGSPPPRTPARYRDALGVVAPARPAGGVHRAGRPRRSTTSSPATPAPTARSRAADVARAVRRRRAIASPARSPRSRREGRVVRGEFRPDGRRARVVRRRRAAPAPPALAGRAAPGGRAGRGAGARPVPARVAGRRPCRGAARRRSSRRSAAAGRRDPRLDRSRPTCCRPRVRGLPAGRPRRAVHAGEVVWVGAGGIGADDGRVALVFRETSSGSLAPPLARDPAGGPGPRRAPRAPARARRVVLARAASAAAGVRRRTHRARRAVGPGVGGRGHQRLARPAAGVPDPPARRRPRRAGAQAAARERSGAPGHPPAPGAGRSCAPLLEPVPIADRGRPRPRAAAPRAPRRAHPRGGPGRGRAGGFAGVYAVLKALEERARSGAATSSPGSARRSSRSPARSTGSATGREAPSGGVRSSRSPPPTRPSPTAPRSPGPRTRGAPRGPPAPTSCSPTASPRRSSNAAPGPCSRSRRAADGAWIDALASLVKDGRLRRIELSRIDGEPAGGSAFAEDLRTAGFVDGYRGLVLRGS